MVVDTGEVRRLCTWRLCDAASVTVVVAATGETMEWVQWRTRGIVRCDEGKERKGHRGGRRREVTMM
jgi:hypothetical protein